MRLVNTTIPIGSLGASVSSSTFNLETDFGYCIVGVVAGATAAGNASLWVSNDDVSYAQMTQSAFTVAGPDVLIWDVLAARYKYVQVRWVRTGGTGTMVLTVEGKGF